MMEPGCWLSAMAAGATLSAPSSTELGARVHACGLNALLTGSRKTEHQLRQRTGLPGIIPSVVF